MLLNKETEFDLFYVKSKFKGVSIYRERKRYECVFMYLTTPPHDTMSVYVEFNKIEFRVFLLLDLLPQG